jgi:hypothetical protein
MFEQVTLKESTISEKAIHLSIQKAHSHKQGNNHSLDRSEVAGSARSSLNKKVQVMQELVIKKPLKEEVEVRLLVLNSITYLLKLIKK